MEKPLISFIVTCYNLPHEMIRECVDSILSLRLTAEEREIIVIDDGSDTPAIACLNDIQDHIVYFRQTNQGLSSARNVGIDIAKGKYIQFVDGDDYLLPQAYGHCLNIVRAQDVDADMVMFKETRKDRSFVPAMTETPTSGEEYMLHHNLRATAWGFFFKKDLLLNLRFTQGIYHEDEEFTPQLILRAERLYVTQAEAYFYRERKNSITRHKDLKVIEKRLKDKLQVIINLREKGDTMIGIDRAAMNRRVAQLTMDYLYDCITLTKNEQFVEDNVKILTEKGFFPLPNKNYTLKYSIFRKTTNYSIGRKLLFKVLKYKS